MLPKPNVSQASWVVWTSPIQTTGRRATEKSTRRLKGSTRPPSDRCPLEPFLFLGGGFNSLLTQTTDKSWYPYSNLSTGGPSQTRAPSLFFPVAGGRRAALGRLRSLEDQGVEFEPGTHTRTPQTQSGGRERAVPSI